MGEVLLTVDTSTQAGSVAISDGGQLLGELLVNVKGTHTDRLLLTIQQLLQDAQLSMADLDCVAVVIGPGAFTGLRVGVATCKGLALATGKPMVGISSLQALALQAPFGRFPVCALLDARKKEVYAGLYNWQAGRPLPCGPEVVVAPERLLESLPAETVFIGEGAVAYQTLIVRQMGSRAHFVPWPLNLPRASSAAALALDDFRQGRTFTPAELRPRYIRLSEAEIMWTRRQAETSIEG